MPPATPTADGPPTVESALTPRQLPGAGAGYPVTLTEAARRLRTTPDHVVDLVRANCLTALVVAAYETTERPPLRFDTVALDTVLAALSGGGDVPAEIRAISEVHAVAAGLRAHLAQATPTDSELIALTERRPLLAHVRGSTPHTHVRAEHVAEHAAKHAAPLVRVRLAVSGALDAYLERLGCARVRGISPADGGAKSWRSWWRVPLSIWSLESEDAMRVDDFPALGGVSRHDDEFDPPTKEIP